MVLNIFCLTYFTWRDILKVHPCCHEGSISSFLMAELSFSKKNVQSYSAFVLFPKCFGAKHIAKVVSPEMPSFSTVICSCRSWLSSSQSQTLVFPPPPEVEGGMGGGALATWRRGRAALGRMPRPTLLRCLSNHWRNLEQITH